MAQPQPVSLPLFTILMSRPAILLSKLIQWGEKNEFPAACSAEELEWYVKMVRKVEPIVARNQARDGIIIHIVIVIRAGCP
jgi:hypothetical protein